MITKTICENCSIVFIHKTKERKFCSIRCCNETTGKKLQGKHISYSHKEKIRKYRTGKKLSNITKKRIGLANSISQIGRTREKSSAWKGGRYIDSHGYILIYAPNHPNKNNRGYVSAGRSS